MFFAKQERTVKERNMAKSWSLPGKNADAVKELVQKELSSSDLPSSARIDWVGHDLQVTIEKAGKSSFTLSLNESNGSTTVTETKRSIALMHKPFVGRVEGFVDELFQKVQNA